MYSIFRDLLFRLDAERAHYISMTAFERLYGIPGMPSWLRKVFCVEDRTLEKNIFGLQFTNPVGLAAGFDKNARYLDPLAALGFGFIEIGTVTPKPQSGNEKPRLFRLPADQALINRMGFNNDGMDIITGRLAAWRRKHLGKKPPIIIGGNIGKNKNTPNEDAWKDYEACFRRLHPYVDYFVINVSSPNTPGLRALQDADALREIINCLQDVNTSLVQRRPLLLKIAPDLSDHQLEEIAALSLATRLDGIVATNTTLARDPLSEQSKQLLPTIGPGGLSGKPLRQRSLEVLEKLSHMTEHSLPIISSGGIMTPEDAEMRLQAGAALVQIWTGFIYQGPGFAARICRQCLNTNHA